MLAIGRPRSLLYFLISVLLVYATAVTAASGHGLVVVCTVVACVYIGILVGAYRFLLQRYVGISIRRLLPELGPAIVGCLALLPVTVSLSHLLGPIFPRVLTVGISGAGGLLVYALVRGLTFASSSSGWFRPPDVSRAGGRARHPHPRHSNDRRADTADPSPTEPGLRQQRRRLHVLQRYVAGGVAAWLLRIRGPAGAIAAGERTRGTSARVQPLAKPAFEVVARYFRIRSGPVPNG
jgi:hypothetical protein